MNPDKTEIASNPKLIERVSQVASAMNRLIATPEQLRDILDLNGFHSRNG